MRGPSEGLHEGPALVRGGRVEGATPQPVAGPRGRDRHAAPPPAVRRRRQGTRGPPPFPPPTPTQAQERTEADRRNGGPAPPPKRPLHPGCGGTTAEAGARTPCPLPADGGPAAPRTAQTEQPYQSLARGRQGREPGRGGSPPPPPAALARGRPIGQRPTPAAARQPPRQEYTPGGHTGDNGWQAEPDGARERPPQPPPPAPPTPPPPPPQAWGPQERPSAPPEPRGRPPTQKGPRRGGGVRLDLHTARPSAPSRLLSRGSRPQGEPTPACRSNARTKLGGGARRRTRTVWRPRPT